VTLVVRHPEPVEGSKDGRSTTAAITQSHLDARRWSPYDLSVFSVFLEMVISLTARQEDFIRQLIELYRQVEGPIHYAALGKELGVSRFTAYDMLRVLEEKGWVYSTYELEEDKSGPGRSKVVFEPTATAHSMMAELAGGRSEWDWDAVKNSALDRIREGRDAELANEILLRIPNENQDDEQYCLELMTILVLRLRTKQSRQLMIGFLDQVLPSEETASPANLSLVSGFALGLLAEVTAEDPGWSQELTEHLQRYQELVVGMDAERRKSLARNLLTAFEPLRE
jgi:DNA-binding PadR family transcriptional regulator